MVNLGCHGVSSCHLFGGPVRGVTNGGSGGNPYKGSGALG